MFFTWNKEQLKNHPLKGELFETYVLGELWKNTYNKVEKDNLYFYRDHQGNEVNVIFHNVISISQLEIKLTQTINSKLFKGVNNLAKSDYSIDKAFLVYGGEDNYIREHININSWRNIDLIQQ